MPYEIILEESELQDAVKNRELAICVPLEIFCGEDGIFKITTYDFLKQTCIEIAEKYGSNILSPAALSELCAKASAAISEYGYEADEKSFRTVCEFIKTKPYANCTVTGTLLCENTVEISKYQCNLLHRPVTDCDCGNDLFAVVIKDGKIVSYSGINDMSPLGYPEIFVETDKNYRNLGYAKSVVNTLSNALLKKSKAVLYDCFDDNAASKNVAKNCGFVSSGKRASFVCYEKEG